MILGAVQTDPAESVRLAAVQLLGDTRRTGAPAELTRLVLGDASELIRKEALASLNAWAGSNPDVLQVIQKVSKQDKAPDV